MQHKRRSWPRGLKFHILRWQRLRDLQTPNSCWQDTIKADQREGSRPQPVTDGHALMQENQHLCNAHLKPMVQSQLPESCQQLLVMKNVPQATPMCETWFGVLDCSAQII
jgi:hypothetical protein